MVDVKILPLMNRIMIDGFDPCVALDISVALWLEMTDDCADGPECDGDHWPFSGDETAWLLLLLRSKEDYAEVSQTASPVDRPGSPSRCSFSSVATK